MPNVFQEYDGKNAKHFTHFKANREREREHTTKHNQILGCPNKRCSADDLSARAVNTKQQQQQQQQEESQQQQQQQQHAAIESSSWKC